MAHPKPTGTIGFVAPFVSGIYYGSMLAGAGQAARRHDLRLLVFQESLAELSRARLAHDHIDAWIVVLNTEGVEQLALTRELHEQQSTLQAAYQRQRALADTVRAIGSPVIPIMSGVLLIPLIGAIDSDRAQQIIASVLEGVRHARATDVLVDVTGVPIIDTQIANALIQMARMTSLLGARTMLVGVRPEIAQSIVGLGIDLLHLRTSPTLAVAISMLRADRP